MPETAVLEQPTTTPVATTESAPAAPATSAPESTPTTSQRPSSFQAAFEQVAAQNEKAAATEPAPAAIVPVASATPSGEVKPPLTLGPSLTDHQKIIENTRAKTRAEVTAEFDRDFGWARQVNRDDFHEIASVAQRLHSDPVAFHAWLGEQLASHPVYSQQLKARPSTQEPQPDVEIRGEDGRVVGMTYSHQRLAERETWLTRQIKADLTREIAPLRDAHQQAQTEAKVRAQETKINAAFDTSMARIGKILDGRVDELGPKVNELLIANPALDPIDAAFQVRESIIKPGLEAKATANAVEIQKQKALGNTANGTGAVVAPASRPKNPKELAAYLATLDGARAT